MGIYFSHMGLIRDKTYVVPLFTQVDRLSFNSWGVRVCFLTTVIYTFFCLEGCP